MPTSIALSWPANPVDEALIRYELLQSKDGGAFSVIASPTVPNHTILNPLPGVYSWKVRAVNFVGTGPESNVTNGPDIPTAPGDITVVVTQS